MADRLTPDDERAVDALYWDLQMMLAGHPIVVSVQAIADCHASTIGFAADDMDQAMTLVDLFAEDVKATIRKNWDYLRSVRASATGIGHG
jgi:hypothetical protein